MSALESSSFDIVLCDVHLPKLDGYGVVEVVKSSSRPAGPPVVAVTALAMVGDRDRLLAAGFDGYVAKPIEAQSFVGEIESYIPSKD